MVRLAVCGANESLRDDIARRVRGARIVGQVSELSEFPSLSETRHDSRTDRLKTCPTSFDTFDAVAYVGPQSPDPAELDQAINAGKHLLLATDTILSVDGLDALVDRAASAGVRVVLMNPDRGLPSRRLIHDELRGSKFGVPGLTRLHRWETAGANRILDDAALPAPLVRDLDLVLWLTQQSPDLVYAVERHGGEADDADTKTVGMANDPANTISRRALAPGSDVRPEREPDASAFRLIPTGTLAKPSTIQVHLGFADGGMALVDYADSLPRGDGYQSLSVICSSGAMYADDHSNRQLAFRGGASQATPMDEGLLPLVNLIQQFVDGLSSADASQSGLLQWRQVRRLAGAVRRSLDAGRAVSMEEC